MLHCERAHAPTVQQLMKRTDSDTVFTWVFSAQYLARNPSFRENLEHGGDPRFESPEAVARQVAASSIASKMKETTRPPHTSGVDAATLVPSDDPVRCLLWGSIWAGRGKDNITGSLASMGFRRIECKDKAWDL